MSRDKNPCIDVCEFSGPKGWCLGCGRTREEAQKWKSLKPYARNILLKELEKRRSRLQAQQSR